MRGPSARARGTHLSPHGGPAGRRHVLSTSRLSVPKETYGRSFPDPPRRSLRQSRPAARPVARPAPAQRPAMWFRADTPSKSCLCLVCEHEHSRSCIHARTHERTYTQTPGRVGRHAGTQAGTQVGRARRLRLAQQPTAR